MEIGIDLVEIARVERLLERHDALKRELFTPGEIAYCERARRPARHYAARFSAKEAALKGLGADWMEGRVGWREIEVQQRPGGKPCLALSGGALDRFRQLGFARTRVTLSHSVELAVAVVVFYEENGAPS